MPLVGGALLRYATGRNMFDLRPNGPFLFDSLLPSLSLDGSKRHQPLQPYQTDTYELVSPLILECGNELRTESF